MKKHVRKPVKIGYKKASDEYIIKLQILGKNNEKRVNVSDPIHAKYRCSKAKILDIFNWRTGAKAYIVRGLYDLNFIYELGKIIESDFDEDLENVCSTGIHYFKTLEQAKYWNCYPPNYCRKYSGEYKIWNDQGDLIEHSLWKDSELLGVYSTVYGSYVPTSICYKLCS